MRKKPPLRSFRTQNFKAIIDSGRVEFGWLTAFIGNNGVGKSSLIEALETFRDITVDGVDSAFRRWRGFEHVWNKSPDRKLEHRMGSRESYSHPLRFSFDWNHQDKRLQGRQSITQGPDGTSIFIQKELLHQRRLGHTERWSRNDAGAVSYFGEDDSTAQLDKFRLPTLRDGESMFKRWAWDSFDRWQFLLLNPEKMGHPTPQQRTTQSIKLARDGSNIAEYLNEIRRNPDSNAFEEILDTLRYVLPYATDLQPRLTTELERAFYLQLQEDSFDIPGWLLSTGTLRIVALLAALRHPTPPPLLVIEEIENGLDPRTLHLVVEEIRAAISAGTTQVILTTHSPYLLDLLDLSHIVVVEREAGQPVFHRPDKKELASWSKTFSPGRLYTMGRLTKGDR